MNLRRLSQPGAKVLGFAAQSNSRLQTFSRHLQNGGQMPLVTMSPKDRIILGLMTFGPPGTEAKGARITTLDDFNKCLDYFQQQGYSEVDTARAYIGGAQEAFSKKARWKERGLTLATKVSFVYRIPTYLRWLLLTD